jgi:acyl carrier protein
MGLDIVEIVLRTEELFVITFGNEEVAVVRTVGDFYKLICSKLNVLPFEAPVTATKLPTVTRKEKTLPFLYKYTPLPAPPEVLPWSPQSVWDCLVAVLVDQQGLDPKEVLYEARFVEDLGVD